MSSTSHLDAASATFIDEFRHGLTSVRDLSGEFNHNAKALKASGGYSCVYAIQWKPSDGDPVQVCYKELRPPASSAPSQVDLTKKTIRHLTREVKIWKSLCHPNIIELIGYAIEGERCDVKAVLVSKWCSNGDVVNYLQRHPESDRVMLIRDMADGLRYLHERVPPMIHGDVKPHNVLISDNGNAQLCDFGLSRVISELTITGQTTSTGIGYTARYSAPEVIVEEVKTTESDVYAFGCTCIHVLFSQPPYPTLKNDLQVLTAIGSGKSPWSWDTGVPLERLLSLCCHKQQEVRPSMDVVLKEIHIVHPPVHPPFASTSTTVDGPSVGSPQKESKDLFLAQIAHSTSDHNKPRPAITFLPVQILVGIFKYLALSDLMRCKQTAKHFLRVIEESLTLQYNIERETCLLAGTAPVAAYLDRPSVAETLTDLHRREIGWASLKWQPQTHSIPTAPPDFTMKLYELQHGFYASVCYKESVLEDSGHLRLQPLPRVMGVPSSARSHGSPPAAGPISPVVQANLGGQYDGDVGVDSSQMPIFNYLGFKAQEFSIDPEQNLAVYLCQSSDPDETSGRMIVRIRQMSDNAFHPFARYETLDTRSMPDELGSYLVQIFGDFVGVMFTTKARFWIWNWKTGICQCELLDSGMDSFLFLSPRHFVISRRKGPLASLEVYAFKPCHYDGPPVKSCLPTRHLATFRLPRLSTGSVYFSHIELVCEPSPVFETPEYEKLPLPPFFLPRSVDGPSITPNNPSEPGPTNGPFVRPRQDDFRIALLSFTVSSLRSERNNYKMFVAVSDIYCMAKCIESNSRTGGVMPGGLGPHADPTNTLPVQVRWDDWGCRSARLLGPLGGNVWVDPAVFMNRYIFRTLEFERTLETAQWGISHSDPQDHVRSRLHVLDFNPYSVRAGSLSGRDETLYPRESGSGDAEHPRMSKDYRISGRMETDLEPTVLHSGDFAYKVISGLPYRQVTSDETFQGDLLPMMDAERILLVDDTTWGSMEVLVI